MAEYTAFVDPLYSQAERNQIGLDIINYIVDRTKNGKGIGNKSFGTRYSKSYIASAEFDIANKSANKINLTLSGDMLDSIEILDTSVIGRIKIGFVSEQEEQKSEFLEEKGYEFLGLTDKELRQILSDFGAPQRQLTPSDIDSSLIQGFVRGIFGR